MPNIHLYPTLHHGDSSVVQRKCPKPEPAGKVQEGKSLSLQALNLPWQRWDSGPQSMGLAADKLECNPMPPLSSQRTLATNDNVNFLTQN